MAGKLYVVGTPIGNLGDLSPRAVQTLQEVDLIAAEDTRVTLKLLNHFGIKKPMISYYEHNLREKGEQLVARMAAGENCAIVTDAGMPCISDPGEDLVRLCVEAGIEVVVVPGPSAVVSALAVSGLSTARFSFEGFLSVKKSSRAAHLEEIRHDKHTLIFYEAPHKLLATLADLQEGLGNRRVALAREITKLHEEVWRGDLAGAQAHFTQNPPRGEFVLVVEGYREDETPGMDFESAVDLVREKTAAGMRGTDAAREVASRTGFKKGDLYKAALQ